MSRYIGAKCKLCRREGEKLFLKGDRCNSAKCAIVKRNYPPGVHGVKGKSRLTNYGIQIREKQKAKRLYGILEAQFINYYKKARRKKGITSDILVQLLETRLDNVIYRLGFASSRTQARQMIGHGLFTVNGKPVNIASYSVKPNDIINIKQTKESKKVFENYKDRLKKHETPSWMHLDVDKLEGKILSVPAGDEIKQVFDPRLIIEFYSR